MTKPFSSNPKLEHWVPSEQQIQIKALDVRSHLQPELTDPQQLLEDTLDFIKGIVRRRDGHHARREEQN